jgi:hypothetical protein
MLHQHSNPSRLSLPGVFLGLLLLVGLSAACEQDSTSADYGEVQVNVTTTGEDLDLNGYTLLINGGVDSAQLSSEDELIVTIVVGEYTFELSGVADNCAVDGENVRTVRIGKGESLTEDYLVVCEAIPSSASGEGR